MRRNARRLISIMLALLMLFGLTACSSYRVYEEGFEVLRRKNVSFSENHLGRYIIHIDFVDEFAYCGGNFYHKNLGSFTDEVELAFVWLSYDEDVYTQAKERYLSAYLEKDSTGREQQSFGFQFFFYHLDAIYGDKYKIGDFPLWLTAFGYNDEEKTLVSIGIYCDSTEEKDSVLLAGTDFGAFLEHFYGDWYEWE